MGFAWHKLIPRRLSATVECPPPCTDTGTYTQSIDAVCSPPSPAGTQLCGAFDFDYTYGGEMCGGKEVLGNTGIRTNPGAPIELRLNSPLGCAGENSSTAQLQSVQSGSDLCYMGQYPPQQFYYYRTPNSPSSTPAQIQSQRLCMKFKTLTVPDRAMVLSGRNRYKYGGWGVEASCNSTRPLFWSDSNVGFTGIEQAEESLSREWPLPNSILNLPLFGANSSANPSAPISPCSDGSCSSPDSCFGIRANTGTGHYGRSDQGNGKGYYSFQCFNPMSFFYDAINYHPVPTCSVWSLVQAIWSIIRQISGNEAQFRSDNPTVAAAFNNLLAANPSGTTVDKSNVRHYLEAFADEIAQLGFSFTIPNVFLWDKDAYIAAGTNEDKWKHIYVVGNANVIFDSQCTSTAPGTNGFVFYLDEVSHDETYGSTGNARLVLFYGCNAGFATNPNSEASMSITTMNCAGTYNPKTGTFSTPCDECPNEDLDLTTTKCYHIGYSTNCDYPWEDL